MNVQITNTNNLSLAMAVWLAHEDYTDGSDEHPGKDVISVTTLLKPVRQLVLSHRLPPQERIVDLVDLIPSVLGRAIHNSIEDAWRQGYHQAMRKLGMPKKLIEKVRINPQDHELQADPGIVPIYLEQRYFREIDGIIISGKFDQIINGELNDTKTTSVYTYMHNTKEEDYRLQGSLYRWINPEKVTSDQIRIQHVFTDWQRSASRTQKNYPPHRVVEKVIQLLTLEETEAWIRARIREIIRNQDLPEPEIVRCSEKDLWRSDPVYKYYPDAKKAQEGGRSTKNFDDLAEANMHLNQMGKGVVITVPGVVRACSYCPAFELCSQRLEYEQDHERS